MQISCGYMSQFGHGASWHTLVSAPPCVTELLITVNIPKLQMCSSANMYL